MAVIVWVEASPSRRIVAVVPSTLRLGRERHGRQAEALGEHRGHDAHRAVGRGHAGDDEVDVADLLDRLGEDERGRDGVGAVDGGVVDVHTLVGAHLQGLLDGVGGGVGADRQDGDLTLAGLDDLEGLLDRVLVEAPTAGRRRSRGRSCCQMR